MKNKKRKTISYVVTPLAGGDEDGMAAPGQGFWMYRDFFVGNVQKEREFNSEKIFLYMENFFV